MKRLIGSSGPSRAPFWSVLALVTSVIGCGEITVAGGGEADEDTGSTSSKQCETDDDCQLTKLACHATAFCSDNGQCEFTLSANACLIDGKCVEPSDSPAFGSKCEICDPATTPGQYTPVSCNAGEICDPDTGDCVVEMTTDVVDSDTLMMDVSDDVGGDIDMPDEGPGDILDTTDPGMPDDMGQPEVEDDIVEPSCETNADCDDVETGPCEGAICVGATGTCTVITLPQGSACSLSEGSSDCFAGTCSDDGVCEGEALSNSACDDGNPCTIGDVCQEGLCVGSNKVCNDQNPCTQDLCDTDSGACTSTPWVADGDASIPCEDGNNCTEGDYCDAGSCVSGDNQCSCETDEDCVDDGNLCNGVLECAEVDGSKQCVVKAGSAVVCDTQNDDSCNVTSCTPATGECVTAVLVAAICDDGDACTFADKCLANGSCAGTAQNCNDQNVCTDDSCSAGSCVNTPNTSACDDGDPCTTGDGCSAGSCAGTPKACNDGNLCTSDSCVGGSCVFTPAGGVACDDGNHCTTADTCTCVGEGCPLATCQGTTVDCNDDNPCTSDSCPPGSPPAGYNPGIPKSACSNVPIAQPCSDNNACTVGDMCSGGSCQPGTGSPTCTGGPCMLASCDPAAGCVTTPKTNGVACDDGSACTTGETCSAGTCGGGTPVCTCDTDTDCDDGNACNGIETCKNDGGVKSCVSGTPVTCTPPDNPCQSAECVPATGACAFFDVGNGTPCGADDQCTIGKQCNAGQCMGTTLPCDDKICQVALGCSPEVGCKYESAPTGSACDDGNLCTEGDKCNSEGCKGQQKNCDDNLPCTADSCSPTAGCVHDPISNTSCEQDGDLCTEEACNAGSCVVTTQVQCDDGLPCTVDSCDGATGTCKFDPNDTLCDDNNDCTKNKCTANGCDAVNEPDFDECFDGSTKTAPDFCFQGSCVGGSRVEPDLPKPLCPTSNYEALHLSVVGNDFYALHSAVSAAAPLCSKLAQRWNIQAIASGGGSMAYAGGDTTELTAIDRDVVVGYEGAVGRLDVESNTFKFEGPLTSAALETGGEEAEYRTVARASTSKDLITTQHALIGGQSNGGVAMLCSTNQSGEWVCKQQAFEGGPSQNIQNYVGSALVTQTTKFFGTELASRWLGSASTDDFLDLWYGTENTLEDVFSKEGFGKAYRGSVVQNGFVWHFGAGMLFRCEQAECIDLGLANKATILDGMGYSGGVVLLEYSLTFGYRLWFLPEDGAPDIGAFIITQLANESNDVYTSLAGTTTTGIYVLGHNEDKSKLVLQRFLK